MKGKQMKARELLEDVKKEIKQEKVDMTKDRIKERLLELDGMKEALSEMEGQLNELLEEEV